jgi:hypothetical protein
MVAAASGRPEEAVEHFETAIGQARDVGAATELAEASYWYARHLLEHGGAEDRERARSLLAEAAEVWGRAGMTKQVERARSLQETL